MKLSNYFIPTLKEDPVEAVTKSHKLMFRAGLIRKIAVGYYAYLPLGLRVFKKVENIVREEMNKAGAIEFSLPIMTPAELWQETGRWDKWGPELMRMKDRSEHWYALGPTHEEVFTHIARMEISSYKQLPVNFYQIKTKFRDEIRPRFGLIRCREFTMKDAYSFDIDENGLEESYEKMRAAYKNIFNRCGLDTVIVQADTGTMGGTRSEEFMVISDVGEAVIVSCKKCGYAANQEKAESKDNYEYKEEKIESIEDVDTPDVKTIEELTDFFKVVPQKFIKTIIYISDENPVAVLIRGDLDVNEVKLQNCLEASFIELADEETIKKITGAAVGFAGPVGLKDIPVYADESVKDIVNGITGANKTDKHFKNVNKGDYDIKEYVNIRNTNEGDKCINCNEELSFDKGIEVGQLFKLGYKYTESMNVTYLDKDQKEKFPIMGCYGIGIDRTVSSIIEQYSDEHGIIWPESVAPFQIIIVTVNLSEKEDIEKANYIYNLLQSAGYEVAYDDRDLRAGIKFNDSELIGIPYRITLSSKNFQNDKLEIKVRKTGEVEYVDNDDNVIIEYFQERLNK